MWINNKYIFSSKIYDSSIIGLFKKRIMRDKIICFSSSTQQKDMNDFNYA